MTEESVLSEREQEILRLVATGASNKEIAQQLVISANTVKVHLRNIFAKIGVVSRTEATLYAIREGLVASPGGQAALEQGTGEAASQEALPGSVLEAAPARQATTRRGWLWLSAAALVLLLAAGGLGLRGLLSPTALPAAPTPAPTPSRWQSRAPLPEPRAYMAAAVYENAVFVIGGETEAGVTGAVTRYDPEADNWEERAEKLTPVRDIEAVTIRGKIYVPGGKLTDGQPTDVLEVYDPQLDTWDRLAALPVRLSDYSLAAFEGRLYLFGGWNGRTVTNSVFIYDPDQEQWREGTPMTSPRINTVATVVGDTIFIMGGRSNDKLNLENEVYDPAMDQEEEIVWETRNSLPEGTLAVGSGAFLDQIYLVNSRGDEISFILQYSVIEDSWFSTTEALPASVEGAAVIPLNTDLYIIGGMDNGLKVDTFDAFQALYTFLIPYYVK